MENAPVHCKKATRTNAEKCNRQLKQIEAPAEISKWEFQEPEETTNYISRRR